MSRVGPFVSIEESARTVKETMKNASAVRKQLEGRMEDQKRERKQVLIKSV